MLNQIAKLIASEGGTVREATPKNKIMSWTHDEKLYVLSWYENLPKRQEALVDLDQSVRIDTPSQSNTKTTKI